MSQMNAQVSKLLTDVSLKVEAKGFVGDLVLPSKASFQYTGLIGQYGEEHLRKEEDEGGGKQAYRRVDSVDYKAGIAYNIEDHGLEDLVTRRDRRNVEKPFDAEVDKTLGLTSKILLGKEVAANDAFKTLSAAVTLTGTNKFSDKQSDPVKRFETAHKTAISKTGVPFNAAVMSAELLVILKYHPGILDALGFSANRAGTLSEKEIADAMGVDKLFVGSAVLNSAKKGQTKSIASIWGSDLFFYHRPESAALRQVTLGYKMFLTGSEQRRVLKYNVDNPPESTGIIVEDLYDYVIVDEDAGYRIAGTF